MTKKAKILDCDKGGLTINFGQELKAVIEKQAKKEGMVTMLEDGIFIAAQGFTTIEEVLRVVSE